MFLSRFRLVNLVSQNIIINSNKMLQILVKTMFLKSSLNIQLSDFGCVCNVSGTFVLGPQPYMRRMPGTIPFLPTLCWCSSFWNNVAVFPNFGKIRQPEVWNVTIKSWFPFTCLSITLRFLGFLGDTSYNRLPEQFFFNFNICYWLRRYNLNTMFGEFGSLLIRLEQFCTRNASGQRMILWLQGLATSKFFCDLRPP